jgi:predicted component of type VI protein secretion system
MMIGRHSSADVRLCLPDISRRHCRCAFTDGQWKVIDLGSLNGTFVNDRRVEETVLVHGDSVRIGCLCFRVDLEPADARADVLQSIADVLPEPELRKAS